MKNNIRWRRMRQACSKRCGECVDCHANQYDRQWLMALHVSQEVALGRRMDFPTLDEHPVLITMVAERDGQIVGAFYLESIPECVFVGTDAEVTASARRLAPQVFGNMQNVGFRMVRLHCPGWLGKKSASIMSELIKVGFVNTDEYMAFLYDLRPAAGGRSGDNDHAATMQPDVNLTGVH